MSDRRLTGLVLRKNLTRNLLPSEVDGNFEKIRDFCDEMPTIIAEEAGQNATMYVDQQRFYYHAVLDYTGSEYAITLPASVAFQQGMVVRFTPNVANPGAVNLNVNGVGARDLKVHGQELPAGLLQPGHVAVAVYLAVEDEFQLVSWNSPLNALYESSERTIVAGEMMFEHGLLKTPRWVKAILRCEEDDGYRSRDDEIDAHEVWVEVNDAALIPNFTVVATPTHVRVYCRSSIDLAGPPKYELLLQYTNGMESIDLSKWRLRVIASVL